MIRLASPHLLAPGLPPCRRRAGAPSSPRRGVVAPDPPSATVRLRRPRHVDSERRGAPGAPIRRPIGAARGARRSERRRRRRAMCVSRRRLACLGTGCVPGRGRARCRSRRPRRADGRRITRAAPVDSTSCRASLPRSSRPASRPGGRRLSRRAGFPPLARPLALPLAAGAAALARPAVAVVLVLVDRRAPRGAGAAVDPSTRAPFGSCGSRRTGRPRTGGGRPVSSAGSRRRARREPLAASADRVAWSRPQPDAGGRRPRWRSRRERCGREMRAPSRSPTRRASGATARRTRIVQLIALAAVLGAAALARSSPPLRARADDDRASPPARRRRSSCSTSRRASPPRRTTGSLATLDRLGGLERPVRARPLLGHRLHGSAARHPARRAAAVRRFFRARHEQREPGCPMLPEARGAETFSAGTRISSGPPARARRDPRPAARAARGRARQRPRRQHERPRSAQERGAGLLVERADPAPRRGAQPRAGGRRPSSEPARRGAATSPPRSDRETASSRSSRARATDVALATVALALGLAAAPRRHAARPLEDGVSA